jgi:hypothetical protein
MTIVYVLIILILLGGCIYFITQASKQKQLHQSAIDQLNKTKEIELKEKEAAFNQHLEDIIVERELVYNESVEKVTEEFEKDRLKFNDYIRNLEKYSRNKGEIITHRVLTELKTSMVSRGVLAESEMIIMGNVFIPLPSVNDTIKTRKMDHLVLLPQGIYLIETKYWRGKIIHGVSKEQLEDLAYYFDSLFVEHKGKEQTIVFYDNSQDSVKEHEQEKNIKVASYENPAYQTLESAERLEDFLMNYSPKFNTVKPILYYGYHSYNGDEPQDYSRMTEVEVCTSREKLENYFEEKIKSKEVKFDKKDLQYIKDTLEKINYFS